LCEKFNDLQCTYTNRYRRSINAQLTSCQVNLAITRGVIAFNRASKDWLPDAEYWALRPVIIRCGMNRPSAGHFANQTG